MSPPKSPRPHLGILFLTVLVDLVGFGIVLPILPFYARDFGASGLQIGLLVGIYSVVQLVMAPAWGRLSDRVGRRPVLLLGLLGSGLAYIVFARADSLAVLFASRIIGGIGGSTIPVAQAYIADVTPPARRAGNMGLIGAAFGLGFIVGPALGGLLHTIDPASPAVPGYTAAALCLANALLALFILRESRPKGARKRTPRFDFAIAFTEARLSRQVTTVLLGYLCITMAFSTLQPTLSLLASERFAMGAREAGYLFALLGIVSVVVQGGVVRLAVSKLGERRLLLASLFPFGVGLLLIGSAGETVLLALGIVAVGIGYGGAVPSVLALLSRSAHPDRQGALLGIGQSTGSLARVIGPVSAGFLFGVGGSLPYLAGAALILLGGVFSARLVQPPTVTSTTDENAVTDDNPTQTGMSPVEPNPSEASNASASNPS